MLLIRAVERDRKPLECNLIPIVVFAVRLYFELVFGAWPSRHLCYRIRLHDIFLAITILTPPKSITYCSHEGNDLASMLEIGSFQWGNEACPDRLSYGITHSEHANRRSEVGGHRLERKTVKGVA